MTFGKLGLNLGVGNLGFGVQLGNGNHGNGWGQGVGGGRNHNNRGGENEGNGPKGVGNNGGGAGLNVNLNLGLNLNIGLAAQIGVGGIAAGIDAGFRPNDQPSDPDAIARLRRQSESIDLQSGRDGNSQTFALRGTPAGQTGPAAPAQQGAPVIAAPETGPGGTGVYGTLAGRAGASGGQATVSLASLDRVVTALSDQGAAQPGQTRGPGAGETSTSPAQGQPGASVSLPTNGDARPHSQNPNRPESQAVGFAAVAPQETGGRAATLAQVQPQTQAPLSPAAPNPAAAAPTAAGPSVVTPAAANPAAAPMGAPQTVAQAALQTGPASVAQAASVPPQAAAQQAAGAAIQAAVAAGQGQIAASLEIGRQPPAAQPQQPTAASQTTIAAIGQPAVIDPKTQAQPGAMQQIGSEAAFAGALAPATGGAPIGDAFGTPVEPVQALGARASSEAHIKRQVLAIEQAERMSGPAAALRELNGRAREMPAESTAKMLGDLAPMLGRAAESYAGSQRIEKVEKVNGILERSTQEISSRASMVRTGADLAAALDAGSLQGMSSHVTKDIARAIANNEHSTAERMIAFGQAVAYGSGLALPFALIEAFDEKGDADTARALETALAGGLARLLKRLNDAVDALSSVAGPVAFEWTAWRAEGVAGPELERRLRARLSTHEGLINQIDEALDAVDAAGGDMVRALERLSRWTARTPEIVAVWREVTSSRKAAFAIAQSLAAQHVIVQALAAGLRTEPPGKPTEFTREAAAELYKRFGFDKDGAAELAEITYGRHEAIQMTGGWVRARKLHDPSSEAAFARVVAFLRGHSAPSNRHIETVTFADLDPDGERPLTLVGAPLLERFELMEAA